VGDNHLISPSVHLSPIPGLQYLKKRPRILPFFGRFFKYQWREGCNTVKKFKKVRGQYLIVPGLQNLHTLQ
jgi:hypothetical protein